MRVLITGANGFVGKNLQQHLAERKDVQVKCFTREDSPQSLRAVLAEVDFVFHLAGVNRPQNPQEFVSGNQALTQALCHELADIARSAGRKIPVVYTSSTQAERDNAYGVSKKGAEDALFALQRDHGVPVHVFRLPNVFGKWCRPNYNSAVATFCHNIARGLPITVNDPDAPLRLVYVDDVLEAFVGLLAADGPAARGDPAAATRRFAMAGPVYATTVGEVAQTLRAFADSRNTLMMPPVGTGLVRALYSTYISYLPPESFAYQVPSHGDARGVFVEMLKTPDAGQFSYFTALPGITRGDHYHHSKTEKFLVIRGHARFGFRHILTNETYEILTSGDIPQVVETVPGWAHNITNIGKDEMVVMLWANEIFDHDRPDTIRCKV